MNITFLGTGTSYGVPILDCNCSTCTSSNPKNTRYRSSLFISTNDQELLIDTTPEMRLQLLNNNINNIDAILFTHSHADHIMGLDDIRIINKIQNKTIPCYGNNETLCDLKNIFNYIFNPSQIGGGIPRIKTHTVNGDFNIGNTKITPLSVKHGELNILGYKINKLAYITDCSHIPDSTLNKIHDIDTLIIEALRYKIHSTHMNIDQALNLIQKLNIKRAFLTHISHEIEHKKVSNDLPKNVYLAYDGLNLQVN